MKKILTVIAISSVLVAVSLTGSLFAAECPGKENRSATFCPGDKN